MTLLSRRYTTLLTAFAPNPSRQFFAITTHQILANNRIKMSIRSKNCNNNLLLKVFDTLTSTGRILILDGGTGEELFRRGVPDDRKIWSATAVVNQKYHKVLGDVHQSFIDSGSHAITTNSYGITPGVGFSFDEINRHVTTSGKIAREIVQKNIVEKSDRDDSVLVLGSLGPLVESYRPDKVMDHTDGVKVYQTIVEALHPYIDCFIAETMSSFEESSQAVDAIGIVNENNIQLPLMVSYTLRADGAIRSSESVVDTIYRLINYADKRKVHILAILFNCSEPEAITRALTLIHSNVGIRNLLREKRVVLGAYANRLTSIAEDWSLEDSEEAQSMRDDLSPREYFDKFVLNWIQDLNVRIVGGCCGITPKHISYINENTGKIKF